MRSYPSAETSYLKTVLGDGRVRVTNYRFIGPVESFQMRFEVRGIN